jgi:hypothetical protein
MNPNLRKLFIASSAVNCKIDHASMPEILGKRR